MHTGCETPSWNKIVLKYHMSQGQKVLQQLLQGHFATPLVEPGVQHVHLHL